MEQEAGAGGHCAPPRPSATGGTAAQRRAYPSRVDGSRSRPAEAWMAKAARLPCSIGPAQESGVSAGPLLGERLPVPVSASAPGPGRTEREESLSLAEPNPAPRGRHSESQDLRARRAEALLDPSTALGQADGRDASKPGGLRSGEARAGRDRAEPRADCAPSPACPGRVLPDPWQKPRLSGRADQPRLRPPAAAFNPAVSRGRAGGGGSRWHCQPLPNARRRRGNEPAQS